MNELPMMEAALFQLRAALSDDPMQMTIRISADVLASAVAAAKEGVNAARVNDIEFALNDLVAAVNDAGASNEIYAALLLLQSDTAALRAATMLPKDLVESIRALQEKLRTRAKAIERSGYRPEGTPEPPLPHPPEELREAAVPLARQLGAAGFTTPSLETLIADPQSLRFHSINEIVDELDVIAGG
jgi:hypothetical protein